MMAGDEEWKRAAEARIADQAKALEETHARQLEIMVAEAEKERRDRRERIATAVYAALLASTHDEVPNDFRESVKILRSRSVYAADALIAALDKKDEKP